MRRILIFLIIAVLWATGSWAATCTCSSTCDLSTGTNWSCGGAPGAADDVVVASGGTLTIPAGTYTNNYLWVKPGGTATVTGTVVWNFNGPTLSTYTGYSEVFFGVGDAGDNRGTFTSNGKDLTINWTGTGSGVQMVLGPHGNGGGTDLTSTNYTAVTMRGVERVATNVAVYSQGATAPSPDTDMVDCLDGVTAPTGGALGDTIVFTGGKSKEFWYEVVGYPDQCTGAGAPFANCTGADATAECSAVACSGGPCDLQIKRNSTSSTPGSVATSVSWSSMAQATMSTPLTAAGGARHATPVDSDYNDAANGDGTLPTTGDPYVVFKPVLIQGATNPITNGITVWAATGGYDWRYVEINKGSGHTSEDCDAGSTNGQMVLWDMGSRILSAEGYAEFINVHNFASRQGTWEVAYTDRPDDVKPNEPRKFRHIYMHDIDPQVNTTCAGVNNNIGRGLIFGSDSSARTFNGVTYEGVHIARWGNGNGIQVTDMDLGTTLKNIVFRDLLIHDWPGTNGYGTGCAGIGIDDGTKTVFDGVSMWNLGQASRGCNGVEGSVGIENTTGNLNTYRVSNAFMVNIDSNTESSAGGSVSRGGAYIPASSTFDTNTAGSSVSNSYIANIVGGAAWGGNLLYSFVKNVVLEDDGSAPCTSTNARGAIQSPVSVIGNVITRSLALSCMDNAIEMTANDDSAYILSTDTRKIISNVLSNMDSDAAVIINGVLVRNSGTSQVNNIDLYNNIIDLRGNTGNGVDAGFQLVFGMTGKLYAYYNIVMNAIGGNSWALDFDHGANANLVENYNRFINISRSPAVPGGNGANDVDSDKQDALVDPWNNKYGQLCEGTDKTRNVWGGPVGPLAFGIKSFNHFHPAVLPLMDADAYRMRYDWRDCGNVQQDIIPWDRGTNPQLAQTYLGGSAYTGSIFSGSTSTVTTTSSAITIPGWTSSRYLNGIRVTAPSSNTDVVYVYDGTTATSSHLPIYPGTTQELPFRSLTIAAVAASGSQTLRVVGLYQAVN